MILLLPKHLLLFFLIIFYGITVSSCRSVEVLGRTPEERTPFVQFKSDSIIQAKEVGRRKKKIIADGVVYRKKDISFLSDGTNTFANIGKKYYASMMAEGKINVYAFYYQTINRTGMTTPHEKLFIQDSGSNELYYLRYKTLKPMLSLNTPEYTVLKSFRKTQTACKLGMLTGFACFIGGVIISGDAINKNQSDRKIKTGEVMVFGGMGLILCTTIPLQLNHYKIKKALAIHNGEFVP